MAQTVDPALLQHVGSIEDRFDIKAVEDALANLWGYEDDTATSPDTIRACSVNIILPVAHDGYDAWQNRIADLARQVPSRILLLEETPAGSKPAIDAHVTATCHRRKGGTLVCSEMVHIRTAPQACLLLPSICRALAVSGLPLLHLSLEGTGMDPQAVHALFELADLTVIDSEQLAESLWSDDQVYYGGDLVWPRLTPWRSAVGHFIATCEEFDTSAIRHVEVTGSHAAAPLFAGWLGCLLRWQTIPGASAGSRVRAADGKELEISFDYEGTPCCGISGLTLTGDDSARNRLAVDMDDEYIVIDARLGRTRVETRVPIRPLSFAEEVASIVHSHGADALYGHARRLALTMLPSVS